MQHTRTKADSGTNKLVPLGVDVRVNVELDGLRNSDVRLVWQLWSADSQGDLYGAWMNSHTGYTIRATTDSDTGSFEFWLPIPKAPGIYKVRVLLEKGSATLATRDSSTFS